MSDFPYLDALERELVAAARASAKRTEGLPSDSSATPAPASAPGAPSAASPSPAPGMRRKRARRGRGGPLGLIAAALVLLGASAGALAATGVLSGSPRQVSSATCEISGGGFVSGPVRPNEESCTYVLSDGQRFRCPGPIGHMTPSVTNLEHSKTCVQLSKLVVPAANQRVVAAIETARSCLAAQHLYVNGGPAVLAPVPGGRGGAIAPRAQQRPLGELDVTNGLGEALIGFYEDPAAAKSHEAAAAQRANRFAGEVERQGAVTIIWIGSASLKLRRGLQACGLGHGQPQPSPTGPKGATHLPSKSKTPSATFGEAPQVSPESCTSGGEGHETPNGETTTTTWESCLYVASDGQRFRCRSALRATVQTVTSLERDKACVQLSRLLVPAAIQAVFATIEKARTCLTAQGLSVNGGPVLRQPHPEGAMPPPRQERSDGELRIDYGEGSVIVGFFENPTAAKRHEATVAQRMKSVGGQVERQGAVDILWIAPPPKLRQSLHACGLG